MRARGKEATTSACRATTSPEASRTPISRSSTTSTPTTSPSTSRTRGSVSGPPSPLVWVKSTTSGLSWANICAWCSAIGPVASTPIAWPRTS